jgi:hypothetical protein
LGPEAGGDKKTSSAPTGKTINVKHQPNDASAHSFHIPVMGTAFTIDTPLRVAKFGISSVISLVDDVLIEQMRKFHCEKAGEDYEEIGPDAEDSRAKRITAYLNMLGQRIKDQMIEVQNSAFEAGSLITKYYEMLPDSPLKKIYHKMLGSEDNQEKQELQQRLRTLAVPGSIDVNIMTKLDAERYHHGQLFSGDKSDALSALRGFAESDLSSSMVFSAGLSRRLYSYAANFKDFFPNSLGELKKKIVLKVSDYRSALIQGKFLAQRGLWISEYRIESGLNCGGHAFAAQGTLLGPILEEFARNRQSLVETLQKTYAKALDKAGWTGTKLPDSCKITVQGGIGTAAEQKMLLEHYQVEGTGWGTPFMLVPEAVTIDDEHLAKLAAAGEEDVALSDSSPLGVKFWTLRNSASEENRRGRIAAGKPGSNCPKGYARTTTEFTERPICTASRGYQKLKLLELEQHGHSPEQLSVLKEQVMAKACICHELSGSAMQKYGIDPTVAPAVCCGPNIANFSRSASLSEMVSHIYGRLSLLTNPQRSHMFITELKLYIENLQEELQLAALELSMRSEDYISEFKSNLLEGIHYYRSLAGEAIEEKKAQFLSELDALQAELETLLPVTAS